MPPLPTTTTLATRLQIMIFTAVIALLLCSQTTSASLNGRGAIPLWQRQLFRRRMLLPTLHHVPTASTRTTSPWLASPKTIVKTDHAAISASVKGELDNGAANEGDIDITRLSLLLTLRAGGQASAAIPTSNGWDQTVRLLSQGLWSCCRLVLPPLAFGLKCIVGFYRSLPKNAIQAQAGLVYCFAGGYYPALFAAVQAAHECGWQTVVQAIDDLYIQAEEAIEAVCLEYSSTRTQIVTARAMFRQTTMTVLKTVDPVKINQATGALYTTWLGVSTVLQREFARTIALSVSIAGYVQPMATFLFEPPLNRCVQEDYHQWVPVLIGWGCKAAAMSIAWRIQRVFTIYTSAITGGLMFSRAIMRMLSNREVRLFGLVSDRDEQTFLDELLGLTVAGLGMYSQIETGVETGFSMKVPFPMSLVTWPFDVAEKWIEWQIETDAT